MIANAVLCIGKVGSILSIVNQMNGEWHWDSDKGRYYKYDAGKHQWVFNNGKSAQ